MSMSVASSNFPKFDTQPNRAEVWSLAEAVDTAEEAIFSGQLKVPPADILTK